jgi:AcrR family transcriptional regulator
MTQVRADGAHRAPSSTPRPGRPRDASIDERAAAAVLRLLDQGSYRELTLDRVAVEAGTSKPALRRRWASLPGVVVHALITVMGTTPTPDTGCLRCDLVAGIGGLAETFVSTPITSALPGLVADLAGDAELRERFTRDYFDARRDTTRAVLARAVDRGELNTAIDVELALDLLAAPLYYRALFAHEPISPRTAETIVDIVLNGLSAHGVSNSATAHSPEN